MFADTGDGVVGQEPSTHRRTGPAVPSPAIRIWARSAERGSNREFAGNEDIAVGPDPDHNNFDHSPVRTLRRMRIDCIDPWMEGTITTLCGRL
jgi:hypothetical protein